MGAVAALLAVVAVVSLAGASAGRGSSNLSTTAPTPPALPCPSNGAGIDAKAMAAPTTTSKVLSWAGVFERIFVKTGTDGTVSKAHQHTIVSATGQGSATVGVPMSTSHLHRQPRRGKPKVVNGVAQVDLKLNGSTVERLEADYKRPLPVTVKVTYKLNGKPVSAKDVKDKKGTVEIDYQLSNTTAKPVNVCFEGFNGATVEQTVTEPAPIYAYFYLTLPKHVSKFTAPGAFVNADRSGVEPQWVVGLFEPLGSPTQTLKVTMDTSRAKIPKATMILEFVEPKALSGSAAVKSAKAVGQARAAAEAAAAKVQADVAALELKAGQQPSKQHGFARGSKKHSSSTSRRAVSDTSKSKRTASLSFGTPTATLAQMQSQVGVLGNANRTFADGVSTSSTQLSVDDERASSDLTATAGSSTEGLARSTSRSIDSLTKSTSRAIDDASRSTSRSLARLATALHRSIDTSSLNGITTRAQELQTTAQAIATLAGDLVPVVSALAAQIQNVVAALPTPVADALKLSLLFGQLNHDLDGVDSAEKTTAAFLKLQADINAGQVLAQTVSDAIGQIQTQAQAVIAQVQTLQSDVTSLQTKITTLVDAAKKNAEDTTKTDVNHAVSDLNARFAKDIATARQDTAAAERTARHQVAGAQRTAKARVEAARRSARRSVTSAQKQVNQAVSASVLSFRRSIDAAQAKVNGLMATVRAKSQADLASARSKAEHGGQATLAAVQKSADQAEAAARSALATANDDYAKLLGLNQQAVAWELPGGDATGVTEQEGSLIYTISGS